MSKVGGPGVEATGSSPESWFYTYPQMLEIESRYALKKIFFASSEQGNPPPPPPPPPPLETPTCMQATGYQPNCMFVTKEGGSTDVDGT